MFDAHIVQNLFLWSQSSIFYFVNKICPISPFVPKCIIAIDFLWDKAGTKVELMVELSCAYAYRHSTCLNIPKTTFVQKYVGFVGQLSIMVNWGNWE